MADHLESRLRLLHQQLLAEIREIITQHEKRVSARAEAWHQQQVIANELQQRCIADSLVGLREMIQNQQASKNTNIATLTPEAPISEVRLQGFDTMPSPGMRLPMMSRSESPYAPTQHDSWNSEDSSKICSIDEVADENKGLKSAQQEPGLAQIKEHAMTFSQDSFVRTTSGTPSSDVASFRRTLTQPLLEKPPVNREIQKVQPSCLRSMISHPIFDVILGAVILINTFFIGYAAEYAARHYDKRTNRFIDQTEWLFCVIFTIEVTLRMTALRPQMFFFGDDCWWNMFDLTLVTTTLWSQLEALDATSQRNVPNTMGLRILRLVRLLKMFRVVRIARFMKELRTIISSIVGSMRTLFWSMVMMTLILYIFGLVFLEAATSTLPDESLDEDTRGQLVQYFGSVYKSMLTLYMATTGGEDWGPMASPLLATGVGYYYLFLFYISFLTTAILNVVMGLFVDAAMKATEKDRIEVIREAADDRAGFHDTIVDLFKEYDTDSNGLISKHELQESFKHSKMQAFLQHLDVADSEVYALFDMLDRGLDGGVPMEDLVQGCFKVSRGAKSIDIMHLFEVQQEIRKILEGLSSTVEGMSAVKEK